ncbi:enoyl-(Acyl carrier protein) reductase domain-containing protein [Ditylenchus destructor]|uniref:Enoyl-(Acyl carrier protein) reductase domain-containing protein n=1 Tax=Ditylenchus destructor TaxID=166010 RepID=A0AAD4R7T9_9BILA|nr:enoyl-(Acyl carrier protein) reductase domain-containing protein [Ditylenchus destructor]
MNGVVPIQQFLGKVVIVTGSSSGIGQDAAVEFAKHGATIVVHGQNKTADIITTLAPSAKLLQITGSLEDDSTPPKIIEETIQAFGRIDILVNNAGAATKPNTAVDSLETLEFLFKVNFKSMAHLIKLALPYLEKTKGNVVNVSSCSAFRPYADLLYYGSLKAAMDHLTRTQAQIYGKAGVRFNTINPGPIRTHIADRHGITGFEKWAVDQTALHRIGLTAETSSVILFLASDHASFVTGANWVVDGGACVMTPETQIIT